MRYIVNGAEVRSENAAKPACFAGRWMLDWISSLKVHGRGLDLGCGKLRYTVHLAKQLTSVVAVDSRIQVDRIQRLFGTYCSVRQYATSNLGNVHVYDLQEDAWRQKRYSVILCSNVLSAIPSPKVRRELVKLAYDQLAPGGEFLITTQYRNSHFTAWHTNPKARPFRDGFLVESPRGTSFYGMIDSTSLLRVCQWAGFTVTASGHAGEVAYVFGTRTKTSHQSKCPRCAKDFVAP
jgi:SAM-dependent methyltransferase